MKKKIYMAVALLLLPLTNLLAQSDDFGIWTSAEVQKKLGNHWSAGIEAEFRTQDGLSDVERWAGTVDVGYKFNDYLKADAAYTYIYRHVESRTTSKGNVVSDYWSPRHRFSFALTGSVKWSRLEFSLRERYQITHRTEQTASKYDGDDGSQKADEVVAGKTRSLLRSRLQVEWDIKKSRFKPYVSCELFNLINDDWSLDKTRLTIGTAYKFNKKHSLDVYYRYQDQSDDDESNGHVIGVAYKFKF